MTPPTERRVAVDRRDTTEAPEDARPVTAGEYEALAAFRYALRKFLRFSESAAREHGIPPQQHQLLLAIKGFPARDFATVTELAERMQLEPHSVVGIVDRCERSGLVCRSPHAGDQRVTEVHLTERGEAILEALTVAHRAEVRRMALLIETLRGALDGRSDAGEKTTGEPEP